MFATLIAWGTSFLGGSLLRSIALYAGAALLGLLFVAYMRYSAVAPYRAQIEALHAAVAAQQRIINDHNALMEEHERQADRLKTQVEEFVHAAKDDANACVLTAAQLNGLRKLAGS
jgi:uncharacterized coiled-coil protein SlyX